MKNKKNHFVDNQRLKEDLTLYREKYIEWKSSEDGSNKKSLRKPQISDYTAKAILLMVDNFARKKNFINKYPYIDEMKGDAVINIIKYVHNYDPEKSPNAFAYLTQYIFNSFINRIIKEQKESAGKLMFLEKVITDYNLQLSADGVYNAHEIINENAKNYQNGDV